MAYTYYNGYKIYYDSLKGQDSIIEKSQKLSGDSTENLSIIDKNYFYKIRSCNWKELGKTIVETSIIDGIGNNIKELNDYIENNLVKACNKAINELLKKVGMIKLADERLQSLGEELEELERLLNQTPKTIKGFNKKTRKEEDEQNPAYDNLLCQVENKKRQINDQHNYLLQACSDANGIISSILSLNGTISESETSSMLPTYKEHFSLLNLNNGQQYYDGMSLEEFRNVGYDDVYNTDKINSKTAAQLICWCEGKIIKEEDVSTWKNLNKNEEPMKTYGWEITSAEKNATLLGISQTMYLSTEVINDNKHKIYTNATGGGSSAIKCMISLKLNIVNSEEEIPEGAIYLQGN